MAVGCSYVRVPTPEGDVIARTMELGAAVKNGTLPTWTLAVHPSLEQLGKSGTCANMGAKAFAGTHGFVSLDLSPGPGSPYPEAIPTDGINAVGLTISQHTLQQSVYQDPNMSPHHRERICFADFTAWVLSSFATVGELATALNKSIVVSSGASYTAPYGLHWAIDDAEGGHMVVEYLQGSLQLHNNTVGVLTNDPDYIWHLRNLNNFASLSPMWPSQSFSVPSAVGALPAPVGHGFNLRGIPGDSSPPGRFVKLFYLREYAVSAVPAQSIDDGIVAATGLMNNVWITQGTVAENPSVDKAYEFTHYTVLKLPSQRKFYFKSYRNTQWKLVQLDKLDLFKKSTFPVDDGSLGIKDVTRDL